MANEVTTNFLAPSANSARDISNHAGWQNFLTTFGNLRLTGFVRSYVDQQQESPCFRAF